MWLTKRIQRISESESAKTSESDNDSRTLSFDTLYDTASASERVGCCSSILTNCWNRTLGRIGGDWFFLFLIGVLMAWISLLVEYGIAFCINARIYLYRDLISHPLLQYLGWVWLPVCLILFSTAFTRLIAPQAAGSGIPEMKTIMKGVPLKESFTFKALVAKIVGLTATLGTGLPLGKEGPFVHIASIAAILLIKVSRSFRGLYENKSRNTEILAAACAVGVATAFAAPIGGVLFSIEVTAVHFAVRNYWRGFFAAVCGTVMHRLLAVWFAEEETLTALFRTTFTLDTPFAPQEVLVFALIGALCGLLGALFVWSHRKFVTFKNKNKFMKKISKQSFLLYPLLVTLLYTTLTFPLGFGMFIAGDLTTHKQVSGMFANFSWLKENPSVREFGIISGWRNDNAGIFVNLVFYIVFTFLGSILASTIPVPSGIFIPVFKMGAALGRLIGEVMFFIFPHKVRLGYINPVVIPGGYSIVGAAALAGAVTHTVSSSVIAFELTGQLTFGIPVMIAVFIANAVAQMLQPSIFDSIITMKKLPYLPSIPSTSSKAYDIYVEDFMVRKVRFIWYGITYDQLKDILVENKKIKTFPIVDSADSMILLGSAQRNHLITLIEQNLSLCKRNQYLEEKKVQAEKEIKERMKIIDEETRPLKVQIKDISEDVDAFDRSCSFEFPSKDPETRVLHTNGSTPESNNLATGMFLLGTSDAPDMERRPSRFMVTKVTDPFIPNSDPQKFQDKGEEKGSNISFERSKTLPPRKGILKKTNSFRFKPNSSTREPFTDYYATIDSSDSKKLRQTLSTILKTKTNLKVDLRSSFKLRNELLSRRLADKIELEKEWEEEQMRGTVDFSNCRINPAPHQLVERSNLLQVHSIFSLLGLNHSYVTAIGRLIGVVSLKELREVIERVNSGEFSRPGIPDNRKYSFGFISFR